MRKWSLLLCSLLFFGALTTSAQVDTTPPALLEAAIETVLTLTDETQRPTNWQYQTLEPTNSSALRCPGVEGTTLPDSVIPIRISLFYNTTIYVLHGTADGELIQPCDAKLGVETSLAFEIPGLGGGVPGCQMTASASFNLLTIPDNSETALLNVFITNGEIFGGIGQVGDEVWYQIDYRGFFGWVRAGTVTLAEECAALPITFDFEDSVCVATAQGTSVLVDEPWIFASGLADAPYETGETLNLTGRTRDNQWFLVDNIGWISIANLDVTQGCYAVPVVSTESPDCTLSPIDNNTNVRQNPTTDAPIVTSINANELFPVQAKNTAGNWYFIEPGWVAEWTVDIEGDCTTLVVNDDLEGTGFLSPSTFVGADIFAAFECNANFNDYLEPRITTGENTAQVVSLFPNRLRNYPSTDDSQSLTVGSIPANSVIDVVVDGPVCNEGFVWWLVLNNGILGWTAESDFAAGAYYLAPNS